MDEKFELACFQIITYVGTARTHFINADLLTMDANGEISNGYMLLMHAEDQLMSAESFRILADEFIALYKRIDVSGITL